ncbi:MAG: YggS family pyridoxal phosphate-dependent enzyme [Bacteroidales bacterium]
MSISNNIKQILKELPDKVKLVAISKTHPAACIEEAYACGQRIFGENKVQELTGKYETLPKDIEWHFIGHLQSNKVKYLAPFIALVHGVDSMKLLAAINKEAKKNNRVIDCLLQFHIADETTKFGLDMEEAREILESADYKGFGNVRVVGVMGMGTFTDDEQQTRQEFKNLKAIFETIKAEYFAEDNSFSEISMGMSGDYKIAIEQGSTMVRIGSTIFGERSYH